MLPYFPRVKNGITCLLVETEHGPVLVDTGLGLGDYLHPRWLMRFFTAAMRSPRDVNETAFHQVQCSGYHPADVRHIIMTHLHFDHAGGLPDFPHAKVHLYQPEYEHITQGYAGWAYAPTHWAHKPEWVTHSLVGEQWFDFDGVQLPDFTPEIWLVPLTGHTPGHAAVVVKTATGWIMHAGDAVPFNMAVDDVPERISRWMIGPHVPRIRAFMRQYPEVQVVGAHMALDFYEKL